MSLKQTIRRILREEDYSPAGKEITPNSIVVHKSNPMFRDKIMSDGLKVKAGECYRIYVGYGTKCKPAIFATNSTNKRAWFDSTYDDDIWEINTEMIPDVKWFKDRHYESRSKHIVTFQDIPREAITLKYKGSGSGDAETWDKNSPNLFESITRILREETESVHCDCGWSWKLSDGGDDPYVCHKCGKDNSKKHYKSKSIIIEKLLNITFVKGHSDIVCKVEVKHPDEREVLDGWPKYQDYSVTVTFIGGYGTKYWPRTMAVNDKYDYLMEELWETVYNYTNTSCDIYSKYVKECPDETNNISHTELTERCWKGYTQKGMKTMFGKRYPNCIKKKK